MLQALEYSATFASTGRTLRESIDFRKGFGTITGPNEAGKSFSVEMLRWSLFGSPALRGKASDFQKLRAVLSFVVRGESYTVERTPSTARLLRGDEVIVVGTSPVNTRIVQLFGFGLKVFDVACVANQGDLEKLGQMRATERRQMVDSVIGLGVIDDLTKMASDEGTTAGRAAAEIRNMSIRPIEPERPADYLPSEQLVPKIAEKEKWEKEIHQLMGVPHPGPIPTGLTEDRLNYEILNHAKIAELRNLPPPASHTEDELLEIEQHLDANDAAAAWRGVAEPEFTVDELHAMERQHAVNEQQNARAVLKGQIERLESELLKCPACDHEWSHDGDELNRLRTQLEAMPEWEPIGSVKLTRARIANMLEQWSIYNQQERQPTIVPAALTRAQLAEQRYRLGFADQRAKLESEVKPVRVENPAQLLARLAAWKESNEASQKAQARLLEIQDKAEGLAAMRTQLAEAQIYERDMVNFNRANLEYHRQQERAAELQAAAEGWQRAKNALTALRFKVKQYLIPSLNKVASHYLVQMSGGSRQRVEVDEDFEVLVDGQALSTLSGSGKHIANLALRFGLGQVLTNNVFSVFIGDEIDAFMDKERAQNTAQLLSSLKDRIEQILLVTHKHPEADYYITVGDSNYAQTQAGI